MKTVYYVKSKRYPDVEFGVFYNDADNEESAKEFAKQINNDCSFSVELVKFVIVEDATILQIFGNVTSDSSYLMALRGMDIRIKEMKKERKKRVIKKILKTQEKFTATI